MAQKIYVVSKKIAAQAVSAAGARRTGLAFGAYTPAVILRKIADLKVWAGEDLVDVNRVICVLREAWTVKMCGGANRGLKDAEREVKAARVALAND